MATQQNRRSHPWRALATLGVLLGIVFGVVAGGWYWDDAKWTPELALDLQGGTQIILTPQTEGAISGEAIDQAVSIIRQRVDGSGVSEAEVTRQGSRNILVALPGEPDEQTRNLVRQSAQLTFRPVLQVAQGFSVPQPAPSGDPSAVPSLDPSAIPGLEPSAVPSVNPVLEPTAGAAASTQGRPGIDLPQVGAAQAAAGGVTPAASGAATSVPAPSDAVGTAPAPDQSAGSSVAPEPSATPTDGSDLAWITPDIQQQFIDLNCLENNATAGGFESEPDLPLVTCSTDGFEKYVLGPVEVFGTSVTEAAGTLETNAQGFTTGQWIVQLEFDGTGTRQFAEITERLFGFPPDGDARNRFAIVLDNVVVSAPGINEPITAGTAQISGGFTQETAQTLGSQLKFGALPITFRVETEEQISATLGEEQLQRGLLAGAIGLVLVVIYSLIQYRALGLVTLASLAVVAIATYGFILFLSWRQGYRLSLAGVAGLIVAIGVTADSFIIYFERIRDQIRDGRTVATAVEVGWEKARRTIVASDAVSFLAALVLYALAVGSVRGFAFTLGLTTIIDLIVVFLFTKPMVTLLSRTRFFASGHKLSGFDPEHLGSVVARNAVRGGARKLPPGRAGAPPPSPRSVSGAVT